MDDNNLVLHEDELAHLNELRRCRSEHFHTKISKVKHLRFEKYTIRDRDLGFFVDRQSAYDSPAFLADNMIVKMTNYHPAPMYIFDGGGKSTASVNQPEELKGGNIPRGDQTRFTIEVIQTIQPNDSCPVEGMTVTSKTPLVDRFVRGFVYITENDLISKESGNRYGAVYISELDQFFSPDLTCNCFSGNDGGARYVYNKICNPDAALLTDHYSPVTVFLNDKSDIDIVYYSHNGTDVHHANVIKSPATPAGSISARYTAVGKDGKTYLKGNPSATNVANIYSAGGITIAKDIGIGIEYEAFKEWCSNTLIPKSEYQQLVFDDTDRTKLENVTNIAEEIRSENIELKRQMKYRAEEARDVLTVQKTLGALPEAETRKLLTELVQNKPAPPPVEPEKEKELTAIEKTQAKAKIAADISTTVHKGIDTVYKVVAGVTAVCGVIGAIVFSFFRKKETSSAFSFG